MDLSSLWESVSPDATMVWKFRGRGQEDLGLRQRAEGPDEALLGDV